MNRLSAIIIMVCGLTTAAWASGIDFPTYEPRHTEREEGREYLDMEQKQATTFSSTSVETNGQATREYFVPVSALTVTGGITTEDGGSEDSGRPGVRRIGGRPGGGGYNPEDPNPADDMPVGDTPWLFMLVITAVFVTLRARKLRSDKNA